jgi:hypothetical protein
MARIIFRSFLLGALTLTACASPAGTEVEDETSAELTAAESDVSIREAFQSDDGQVVEEAYGPGAETQASASFWQTCQPYKYFLVSNSTGRIVEAYSDSCRRRNGTWGGPTFWSGSCGGDVANCNGVLRCGGC